MNLWRRWVGYAPLLLLPAVFLLALPAIAKGPADKITIGGPALDQEVEIAGRETVLAFSPWDAHFIGAGGSLAAPPTVGKRVPYEVYFYYEDDDGEMELSYVFYYYPAPEYGRSYLYLPGAGEPYYRINASLIMRAYDGKWFNAAPAWQTAVDEALAQATSAHATPAAWPLIVTLLTAAAAGVMLWVRAR